MFGNITGLDRSLLDQFRRLHEEMDELFGQWPSAVEIRSLPRGSFPLVNLGASSEKIEAYLFAPGIDPKSIDISIQQHLLTVAGERKVPADENANYYRQERFSGEFRRVISLPEDIDPDSVDARYRDGVLQISIARRQPAQPRKIQVQ